MSGKLSADQIAELIASHLSVSTSTFEGAGGVACVEGIGKAALVIAERIDEVLTEARPEAVLRVYEIIPPMSPAGTDLTDKTKVQLFNEVRAALYLFDAKEGD